MHFIKRILECFFCWQLPLPDWSNESQALCACTFGRGDDSCNAVIATHITEKVYQHRLPYCVQAEIGHYISANLKGYCSVSSLDTHRKGYVGTTETVREHVERYLRPNGFTTIHVEAHAEHAWRVVMCYRHFGIEVVSLCTKSKPYPSESTQRWCRGKIRFVLYEILARLLYLAKGFI